VSEAVVNSIQIGEGFVGEGADAAHVNTVLGPSDGPVGTAWATALATPRAGHVPFMAVARPGVAVKPPTLFVNKAAIEPGLHGDLTWGAAQAGVAAGVADAIGEGVLERDGLEGLLLIVAVWVNPAASDADAVFSNNREATLTALRNGRVGAPAVTDFLEAASAPWNPFFRPGGGGGR
jgi:5,6,7,8-tetrahydromethanopterin hydro-lyase